MTEPEDKVISAGCNRAEARLANSDFQVNRIDFKFDALTEFEVKAEFVKILAEQINSINLPRHSLILIHGHGINGGSHHIYAKATLRRSLLISGKFILSQLRDTYRKNPIWISSCHSGSDCYKEDVCAGSSCQSDELSASVSTGSEWTLAEIIRLLTNSKVFERADFDNNLVLDEGELNIHFCLNPGIKNDSIMVRLTSRDKANDTVEDPRFKRVIRYENEEELNRILGRLSEEYKGRGFPRYALVEKKVFSAYSKSRDEGGTFSDVPVNKILFDNEDEADSWARSNVGNWPRDRNRSFAERFRGNTRRLSLTTTGSDKVFIPIDRNCKAVLDHGKGFTHGFKLTVIGKQTPQFNSFKLYSPKYSHQK
jgi:hypothetical protein